MKLDKKAKILFVLCGSSLLLEIGISSFLILGSKNSTSNLVHVESPKKICYNKQTGKEYSSIQNAINDIPKDESQDIYVYPGLDINITSNLTVKSNISLYFPYLDEKYNASSDEIGELADNAFSDANSSTPEKLKTSINFVNGSDLIIESNANVYLGGEFKKIGVTGNYCQFILGKNSSIQVSGNFYCYGYVKEDVSINGNSDYRNFNFNNENDQGRYIEVNANGKITTAMGIYDLKSGGITDTLNKNNICPISRLDFPNLQTYTKINNFGELRAEARIELTSMDVPVYKEVTIINDKNSDESSLFYVSDGYIALEYCPSTQNNTTTKDGTTIFYVDGEASLGSLFIDADYAQIDTSNCFLPISDKFKINLLDGTNFYTENKIKFYAGSSLFIEKNATFEINSDVAFYKSNTLQGIQGSDYVQGKPDSELTNNGTIRLDEKGKLGGYISTNSKDKTAKIDLLNISTQDNLTVVPNEGVNNTSVTAIGEASFCDESNDSISVKQLKAGTVAYSFGNELNAWTGDAYEISTLTIQIDDLGYENPIADYRLYIADDVNGSNQVELTTGNTSNNGSYSIANGKYFMIQTLGREKGIQLEGSENFKAGLRYPIYKNESVIITPNEGLSFSLSMESDSGAGYTKYTVYESETENGNFYEIASGISGVTTNIVKDYYYKVEYEFNFSMGGSIRFDETYDKKDGVQIDWKIGNVYKMTNNQTVYLTFTYNAPCFEKGTKVLTNLGYVEIENIKKNTLVMTFNHITGKFEYKNIALLINHGESMYAVIELTFDDGSHIGFITNHGLFDCDLNKYVALDQFNCHEYINHRFIKFENGEIKTVRLVDINIKEKETNSYTLISSENLNCVTNSLLTLTTYLEGIYNIFPYGSNYKYDENEVRRLIKKYGLFKFEDFKNVIQEKVFIDFGFKYFKIAIGEGLLKKEQLNFYINWLYQLIDAGEAVIF